jgi:cytochrome P450 family 135
LSTLANRLPPGPSLPAAVQTVRLINRPIRFLEECRQRFGGTFTARIVRRKNSLVFISDPPSLKRLFAADRRNRLNPDRTLLLSPLLGSHSLLLIEGEEHLARRRLMLPPFHGERMRAYEELMRSAAERELEGWPLESPFPLHPAMQAITLDVILRAVFGVTDSERREELRAALVEILSLTQSPRMLGYAVPFLQWLYRRVAALVGRADELLAEEITERRADPELERREDVLSLLVAARDENGEAMSDVELRDQLMTLLMAGHETTATALAWSFDLLFRNPAAMERATAAAEEGDERYLDAVAEEALRLRPVVPFIGRELEAEMELGGWELPADTTVMPAIYLAHTRGDVFEDPYAFRPERFLDGGPETYSWVPFGGGTRRCIGAAFAQFEMRVVLRTILARAELRPATHRPEPMVRRNVTLAPRNGTPAILTARR